MEGKIVGRKKRKIQHGSLFSGIGGFDLAADWCGWENAFHCEISEFCNSILKHYWPHAESIKNIEGYDWKKWKNRIDVLSGGFPCQPYSVAGKRLGKEDPRHLWPEMLRAVHEIRPGWVVGENVRGIISWNGGMVFEEVQSDLEAEGYDVLPFLLPAAGVNAPHKRERIWFIGCRRDNEEQSRDIAADTDHRQQPQQPERSAAHRGSTSASWHRLGFGPGAGDLYRDIAEGVRQLESGAGKVHKPVADANRCKRCKGWLYTFRPEEAGWQSCTCHTRALWDPWEEFPTQSPVCNGDDGVSSGLDGITFPKWRTESIKAGGNAIVPQVAFQIFLAIHQHLRRSAG